MKGYVLLLDGEPVHDSARSSQRNHEVGRLFVAGAHVTVWPNYQAARRARDRATRAWGEAPTGRDARDWRIKPLRAARRRGE